MPRSLDVEREARSRLRPLKRQAEAAELHERLERQTLEARLALASDAARSARLGLSEAEQRSDSARRGRDEAERLLAGVARRREEAEEAFAAHSREREHLQAQLYAARSAADRIAMRLERVLEQGAAAKERRQRRLHQLELLESQTAAAAPDTAPEERIRALEEELQELDAGLEARLARELEGLQSEGDAARKRSKELEELAQAARAALDQAERTAAGARAARREAEHAAEAARAQAAAVGADLAAANRFVRSAAPVGARSLAEGLQVEPGYELALAAALGPRLSASVVDSLAAGEKLLDAAGKDGGSALVEGAARRSGPRLRRAGRRSRAAARPRTSGARPAGAGPAAPHRRLGGRFAGRAPARHTRGDRHPLRTPVRRRKRPARAGPGRGGGAPAGGARPARTAGRGVRARGDQGG